MDYWTGKITTKAGMVYEFSEKDIVKGSGYISSQCCGNTEMELGTVYAAEMGITLFSEIDRYTLEDALVELYYHLLVGESYETVPMGLYEISEANRSIRCLEIKAYDYMIRFEKDFNITDTIGNAYEIIMLCCKACKVEFAHTQTEIESMPNHTVSAYCKYFLSVTFEAVTMALAIIVCNAFINAGLPTFTSSYEDWAKTLIYLCEMTFTIALTVGSVKGAQSLTSKAFGL